MILRLLNRQRALPIRRTAFRSLARSLLQTAPDGRTAWNEVAVFLLDDAGIREVHRAVFGSRDVTDVIVQPYLPGPAETRGHAELFLNAERAAAEGRRRPGGPARELALYLVHGCLHLAGETDGTPRGRARMRRLERARLARADDRIRRLLEPGPEG